MYICMNARVYLYLYLLPFRLFALSCGSHTHIASIWTVPCHLYLLIQWLGVASPPPPPPPPSPSPFPAIPSPFSVHLQADVWQLALWKNKFVIRFYRCSFCCSFFMSAFHAPSLTSLLVCKPPIKQKQKREKKKTLLDPISVCICFSRCW